jgi:hypothetical protein
VSRQLIRDHGVVRRDGGLLGRVIDRVLLAERAEAPMVGDAVPRDAKEKGAHRSDRLALLEGEARQRRRLLDEFRNASKGLENMRFTYCADSVMVASLDVLLEKLLRACAALEESAVSAQSV